jgi:hypothetical protein
VRRGFATIALLVVFSGTSLAQSSTHRFAVGVQVPTMLFDTDDRGLRNSPGIGSWFGFSIHRRLSLEGRIEWFPRQEAIRFGQQGGRTVRAAFGARATFLEIHGVAVYGVLMPGLIHFNRTVNGLTTTPIETPSGPRIEVDQAIGSATHLAMTLGAGVEVRVTDRLTALVDAATSIYSYRGAETPPGPPGPNGGRLSIVVPSDVLGTQHITASVGYRFGSLNENRVDASVPAAWEIGIQTNAFEMADTYGPSLYKPVGIGGFGSYRLLHYVFADASIAYFSHPIHRVTDVDGGDLTSCLAGAKLGIRRDRLGFFGKARFGSFRWSKVLKTSDDTATNHGYTTGQRFFPAFDLGGIVEVYERRFFIRLDAGATSIFHRVGRVAINGIAFESPADPAHLIAASVGFGMTFH